MSGHTHRIETTVLRVTFEPCKGGTQLTVTHRGVPDDEDGLKHQGGWGFLLGRVEQHFTGDAHMSARQT